MTGNVLTSLFPSSSIAEATAEIERAEAEYIQKAKEFQAKNASLLAETAANPSKAVMRIADLESRNATLVEEIKERKVRVQEDLVEKRALKKKSEKLERALEMMARRMDTWERSQKLGAGMSNRDAKDIYKDATGKDLGEEGYYGVEPSGSHHYTKGTFNKSWTDPRMDRAVQAKWDDPSLRFEEALRIGGFDFLLTEKYGAAKDIEDADGVPLLKRKAELRRRIMHTKIQLAKKGRSDPEAMREYRERYPEVAPPPPFAGLDLSSVPDQPLITSAASATGYRGVLPREHGKYNVGIGNGTNGGKVSLGWFEGIEEAAMVYAKARYYIKTHGIPSHWTKPPPANDDDDDDCDDGGDVMEDDGEHNQSQINGNESAREVETEESHVHGEVEDSQWQHYGHTGYD